MATRIHDNQLKIFDIGSPIPGVTIRSIEKADHFTYPGSIDMGPERSRLKSSLFCVDTSRERIYTPFHSISKFCAGKGRDYRLLVYVDGGFSFILHPQRLPGGGGGPDDFNAAAKAHEGRELRPRTCNKISPFGDYFYQQGGDPHRDPCRLVEFQQGDVCMSGEWSVIMDFTTQKAPAPAVSLPARRKPLRMPPSVGMDL